MTVMYNRVALIGLGLIASSMFWAMKRADVADEVTGYARSSDTRDVAREIGLCDRVCDSAADAVAGAAASRQAKPRAVCQVLDRLPNALCPGRKRLCGDA